MDGPVIENGAAKVAAGDWLMARSQPAAASGVLARKSLRGFIVPDRAVYAVAKTTGDAWCASAEAPFLTYLTALPDEPLSVVSRKVLVAPAAARTKGASLKLIPFSFARATAVTAFQKGWVVVATKSRVTRTVVEDGGTLQVNPDALVAWIGPRPTGFCPKLSVWDMFLPRAPRNLSYTFHGPSTVWFEGSCLPPPRHPWSRSR